MATVKSVEQGTADLVNVEGGADAALYMETKLSGPVRSSIETVLRNHPPDPIRLLAQSLRSHQQTLSAVADASGSTLPAANGVVGSLPSENVQAPKADVIQRLSLTAAPPLSLALGDGRAYQIRPVAVDFARSRASQSCSEPLRSPPPSFPSVLYREGASIFEVGSCLQRLQQCAPEAPLLLIIESPAPNSTIFFYEGSPYVCSAENHAPCAAVSTTEVTEEIRVALSSYGGAVHSFSDALCNAATEAVSAVRIELLPSLQTNYLAVLDQIVRAVEEVVDEGQVRAQAAAEEAGQLDGQSLPLLPLPSVLLVTYRPETARLTHARLLAAYGPYYEAAQRQALLALRQTQLERKKKFTFTFAMEYWSQVRRRRETSSNTGAASTKVAIVPPADASAEEKGGNVRSNADAVKKTRATADGVTPTPATKPFAKEKRAAARSTKRGLPTYDAEQQAEDDVFLIVIRRMEHAAATLIQSVYRGYRARARCQQERRPHSPESWSLYGYRGQKFHDAVVFGVSSAPPLLHAALERLCDEGEGLQDIWTDFPTSPPPDSRRCWIYRPVQHVVKAALPTGDTAGCVSAKEGNKAEITRVHEDWVQEELLIPPLRATQPRIRINLAQRLIDYFTAAQCTVLHDTVQLFADCPGMSILQRRAYDSVKSIFLTLFFVAYAELRQRDREAVPPTFSQYICEMHKVVLAWCEFPHACSLLLRAARQFNGDAESAGERAAVEYVQRKLAAHETFLVAYKKAKADAPADDEHGGEVLTRLSTHLFLSSEPLLSSARWSKEMDTLQGILKELNSTSGPANAEKPVTTVDWWSIAAMPLCCVEDTPVAAIDRWDKQLLDGVPAYDCFVPHARTVPADSVTEGAMDAAQLCPASASTAAIVSGSSANGERSTSQVIREWLCGDLAGAADDALAQHTRAIIDRDGYLECYRAKTSRNASTCGNATATGKPFTDIPHDAVLTKYVGVKPAPRPLPPLQVRIEDTLCVDADEGETAVSNSHVARHRPVQHRRTSRQASFSSTLHGSESDVGGSRRVSRLLSTCSTSSVGAAGSLEQSNTLDDKAVALQHKNRGILLVDSTAAAADSPQKPCKPAWRVRTVTEVADEVAASCSAVTLFHRRQALRFVPGLEGAEMLDLFVDKVATAVMKNSSDGAACLVLGLDTASQAFFALAAMLIDHRLHNTRDVSLVSAANVKSVASAPCTTQCGDGEISVDSDEHLRFLCEFHEIVHSTLADTSASSTSPGKPREQRNTSVRLAVEHVSRVMNATAKSVPSLSLLSRIKHALQQAEAARASYATDVQFYTTAALQLAEQYAWLVLLEWYLWSPQFPFSCANGFTTVRRRSSARAAERHGFAEMMRTSRAPMQWIEEMDPWAAAPERCPDPLHRRYSNGLRRWDDKHYVCFGAL
ncbi:hypothetical protein ABL78_0616 [Leptomonas seymouri]|uniref:Uncharacterized protein n=1 Tax=Leptomonas seymouri TaxID=5684 RepID=A0A0N1I8H1_LEPSE|nr:hypothetical protein ABL78_0616 [Leptomonas seymouri]|eukprot:KPI90234.1 hypothetical protein ABL78_0616 [Leptomonas seymouri]